MTHDSKAPDYSPRRGLTRAVFMALVAKELLAQPSSEDVQSAILDLLIRNQVVTETAFGLFLSVDYGGDKDDANVTGARLRNAVEVAITRRPGFRVLVPVLRGRPALSTQQGGTDEVRGALAELEQNKEGYITSLGRSCGPVARIVVHYVINVYRSRLREEVQPLGQSDVLDLEQVRTRSREQRTAELNEACNAARSAVWNCTYHHFPTHHGFRREDELEEVAIQSIDWFDYSQRYVGRAMREAVASVLKFCEVAGIDSDHLMHVVPTAHDAVIGARGIFVRDLFVQLASHRDDEKEVDSLVKGLAERLSWAPTCYRHFHSYFEGLDARIEQFGKDAIAELQPRRLSLVQAAESQSIDPSRIDVIAYDEKVVFEVDRQPIGRLAQQEPTPNSWLLLQEFCLSGGELERAATPSKGARRKDPDELEGANRDESNASDEHHGEFERPQTVRTDGGSDAKWEARRKAVGRLGEELMALLNLTRSPFVAIRGSGYRSLFRSMTHAG